MNFIPPVEAVEEERHAAKRVQTALNAVRRFEQHLLNQKGFAADQWQQAYNGGWFTQAELAELRTFKAELERALEWYGEISFSIVYGQV